VWRHTAPGVGEDRGPRARDGSAGPGVPARARGAELPAYPSATRSSGRRSIVSWSKGVRKMKTAWEKPTLR